MDSETLRKTVVSKRSLFANDCVLFLFTQRPNFSGLYKIIEVCVQVIVCVLENAANDYFHY